MKGILYSVIAYLLCTICWLPAVAQRKQSVPLNHYLLKENLIRNNKLAIIACDSTEQPTDRVNGNFSFTINGFKQDLNFRDGVAITPQEIDKSSFVFLKHENTTGSHVKLYYVIKGDSGLNPIKINWMVLVLIPVALILLASLYKKLIILAALILVAYFYFNHHNGLSIGNTLETVLDGIKQLIS